MEIPENIQYILNIYKPIDEKTLRNLLLKYRKTKDEKIKSLIINSNMHLVVNIAKKIYNKTKKIGVDSSDIIEEGMIGLLKAINRYRPQKGNIFSTYATYWIKESIYAYMKEKPFTAVQLPLSTQNMIKKWTKEWLNTYKKYGRYPTINEIVKKLRISPYKAKKILHIFNISTPMDLISNPIEDDITVEDTLSDKSLTPEELIFKMSNYESVREVFTKFLTRKEYTVVKLRYQIFLKSGKKMSYRKISKILHISPEYVRKLEKNALEKLRKLIK
ncbi:MAG: sigma-70 family RNA polymerase sigma factor [Endomicrobia bacterium]|nr:sigma-70 family RNA polymerase sigma factor [Endomicrobiia bacterium]